MTTVVDPAGTPVVVFNRDGVAIMSLTCGRNGVDPKTTVDHFANITVVLATDTTYPENPAGFKLSSGFEIGDVVEFYNDRNGSAGGLFDEDDNALAIFNNQRVGNRFRKVATGTGHNWRALDGS